MNPANAKQKRKGTEKEGKERKEQTKTNMIGKSSKFQLNDIRFNWNLRVCGKNSFLTDSQKNSKNKDICFFLSQAKVIREEKIEEQAVRATTGNNGQQ